MSGTVPFHRFVEQPDANRGVALDIRSAVIGRLEHELRGPWVQGIFPTDWTLYVTREVIRAPAPSTLRERGATVYADIGSGVGAVQTMLVSRLPLRGVAVHVAAESVRAKIIVDVDTSGDIAQDRIISWLAPGRPSVLRIPDDIDIFPSAVPQFARRLFVQGTTSTLPPGAAPTDVGIEWRDIAGTAIATSWVNSSLYYNEQSFLIPWNASSAVLVDSGGGLPLPLRGQWETYA